MSDASQPGRHGVHPLSLHELRLTVEDLGVNVKQRVADASVTVKHRVADASAAVKTRIESSAAYQTVKSTTDAQVARVKAIADAQAQRLETALRNRFGGYDDSNTAEKQRARALVRYRRLFDLVDGHGRGAIPIDELEAVFGAAGLLEARTEVGQLAYDADEDGNGALDFDEFTKVMDILVAYQKEMAPLVAAAAEADMTSPADRSPRSVVTGSGDATHSSGTVASTHPQKASFVFGTEGAALSLKQVSIVQQLTSYLDTP